MWSRRTWILIMVGTTHSGIFTVRRYTMWWRRKRKNEVRGVSCLKMQIVEIARSFRPPFFVLSFTKVLSDSPLPWLVFSALLTCSTISADTEK